MNKSHAVRHFTVILAIAAIALPMSASGESRRSSRTDLEKMAAELASVLGSDAVSIERNDRPPARQRSDSRPPAHPVPIAEDALEAMNRERRHQGLAPLRLNPRLSAAAADRASDMHHYQYFDHVSPSGRRPADFAGNRGYRFRALGENLAAGFRSGDSVVSAWMRSPGHRANILGNYQEVGIASLPGSPVRGYGGDTWVALYGTGM